MRTSFTAPAGWDHRIVSVALSRDFAAAMAVLGWRPLYAWDDSDLALVLIRRLAVPGLGAWTTRAKVYLNEGYPTFVRELESALADEGVAYAVIGDAVWPLPPHLRMTRPGGMIASHHRIVHDVQRSDEAMLAGMHPKMRSQLRRAERDGVTVAEIAGAPDLSAFVGLAGETADRIRRRNLVAALPDAFFGAVYRTMVPRGEAVFLLARRGPCALAGGLFLRLGASLTYYHGVSTREPSLVGFQGPSAMFWHAMRYARTHGLRYFDHGAVTVTDDPGHPNHSVYLFKRRLGGTLEEVAAAHLVLSRTRHAFQERVLRPLWMRLYPLYMRWNGRPKEMTPVA